MKKTTYMHHLTYNTWRTSEIHHFQWIFLRRTTQILERHHNLATHLHSTFVGFERGIAPTSKNIGWIRFEVHNLKNDSRGGGTLLSTWTCVDGEVLRCLSMELLTSQFDQRGFPLPCINDVVKLLPNSL